MSKAKTVVFSMWWSGGLGDNAGAVKDVLDVCGFPVYYTTGADEIMNFKRSSSAPKKTAPAVLAVALDELHAQRLPMPTDVVVFTPDDDEEVYYWGAWQAHVA